MDTGSFTSTFRNGTKLKAVLTDKKLDISSQRKWGGGADGGHTMPTLPEVRQ